MYPERFSGVFRNLSLEFLNLVVLHDGQDGQTQGGGGKERTQDDSTNESPETGATGGGQFFGQV